MSSFYGREAFIKSYTKMLTEISSNHFLLTGKWGSGKSTIIKQMKEEMENEKVEENEFTKKVIIIDAWENDHLKDPNLLILNALLLNRLITEDEFKGIAKSAMTPGGAVDCISEIANGFFENRIGIKLLGSASPLKGDEQRLYDSSLTELAWANYYKSMAEKTISKAISEKNIKLIIFIDELDRCRPDFTLKLIEKFHHLDLQGIFVKFVYVSDKVALTDIVNNYYGFGLRSTEYLEKMFHLTTEIPLLNLENVDSYFKSIIGNKNGIFGNEYLGNGRIRYDKTVEYFYKNDFTFRNINTFYEDIISVKLPNILGNLKGSMDEIIWNSNFPDDFIQSKLHQNMHFGKTVIQYYQALIMLQISNSDYQYGIRINWLTNEEYQSRLVSSLYNFIETIVPIRDSFFNQVDFDDKSSICLKVTDRLGYNNLDDKEKKQKQELFGVLNLLIRCDPKFSDYIY